MPYQPLAGQLELFEVGPREVIPLNTCTPARPGTGPKGAMCKTCAHKTYGGTGANRYLKGNDLLDGARIDKPEAMK